MTSKKKMSNPKDLVIQYHTPAVEKFCGRINGKLTQPLENFISSIEFFLNSKGVTDPKRQYAEAKGYLDGTKGDVFKMLDSHSFKSCETWDDLKKNLIKIYRDTKSSDPVIELRKVLKLSQRLEGDDFATHSSKVFRSLETLIALLENSEWAKEGFTLEKFSHLMYLALNLRILPDSLVMNITRTFKTDDSLIELFEEIEKHKAKVPNFDNSLITPIDKSDFPSETVAALQDNNKSYRTSINKRKGANNFNRNYVKFNTNKSSSSINRPMKCQNCAMTNHQTPACRSRPFCEFHWMQGHRTSDCYAKRNAYSSNNRSFHSRQNSSYEYDRSNYPTHQTNSYPASTNNPFLGRYQYPRNNVTSVNTNMTSQTQTPTQTQTPSTLLTQQTLPPAPILQPQTLYTLPSQAQAPQIFANPSTPDNEPVITRNFRAESPFPQTT